jgi:lipoprotein-anchoring transpeptidase ErfK/SrfK
MQRRISRPIAPIALFVALAFALAACGGGSSDDAKGATGGGPTTATTPAYVSYIATAKPEVTKVAIFESPTAATPKTTLDNPWLVDPDTPSSTVLQVFLVEQQQKDWVQVLLPIKPNGSVGWVHASDVTISSNTYAIKVSLGSHAITVTDGTTVIYTGPVAIGATDPPLPDADGKPTPTPTGKYYLRVLLQAPDPNTVYGPYAYGLSSHSDTLDSFQGGDAEIGIHGNNDPSVLGKSVTHGCVRMDNAAITMLSKRLPLGTPVDIVA